MAAFLQGSYPGGTTDFLRADGQWTPPPGGGSGAVDSVNGQTGVVVLTAAEVGADASGAAAAAQAAAEAASLPLPSGTPAAGAVPVATGTGTATAWSTAVLMDETGGLIS
jgi:hypothetical protein